MRIGILALQGDYEAHGRMLRGLDCEIVWVRKPAEAADCDGLIIPGGESTTLLKFLEQDNFLEFLRRFSRQGKPIFGTCAGAILLAIDVTNPPQTSLKLMDVTVERNGYGRQLSSEVRQGSTVLAGGAVEMVFIRAPRFVRVGERVEVLAVCGGEPVCVRDGLCLAAAFHPELGGSPWLHRYFLGMVREARSGETTDPVKAVQQV